MSEPTGPPPEPIERMLRRWGAEQAAREEPLGRFQGGRRLAPGRWTLWTWISVSAAACAIVVASVAVTMWSVGVFGLGDWGETRPQMSVSPPRTTQPDLGPDAGGLRTTVTGLSDSHQRLLGEVGKLADELDRLRESLRKSDEAGRAALAETAAQRAELERRLGERLAALGGELAKSESKRAELAKLVEQANRSLEQLRQADADAAAAQAVRLAELDRVQAALARRQAATLAAMQDVYLAADQVPPDPLRARQQAIRRSRLLARCAALRPNLHAAQTRTLFDALEVWLTRVDLANPNSSADLASVRGLLDPAAVRGQIEQVLAGGGEPAAVNAWLVECELLLIGLDRAG